MSSALKLSDESYLKFGKYTWVGWSIIKIEGIKHSELFENKSNDFELSNSTKYWCNAKNKVK